MLDTEFQYYITHQEELVKKYKGKHIVIIGTNVVGIYDSLNAAYFSCEKQYKPGTFFIQKCVSGNEAYTLHFRNQFI